MRKIALSAFTFAALSSVAVVASAQSQPDAKDPRAQNRGKPIVLHREGVGGADAQRARTRARGGDCKGALSAFDAALENSVDPTLYRDRGLCHEQLGHPYPAIDDYRAYLVGKPDAPDADQIRGRLADLEKQVGQGGSRNPERASEANENETTVVTATKASGSAKLSLTAHASSNEAETPEVIGPKQGDSSEHGYDYYKEEEDKRDEAESTGLRAGTGPILGAFVHVPRFFFGSGATSDMGYAVGGTLRYATSPLVSAIGEIGYAGVGKSGQTTALGGPLALGGVEFRLAVDKYARDHILLGGGLGFERYTVSGTRISANFWSGRFRAGFRHVFGPQVGVEFLLDGGPVLVDPEGGGSSRVNGVVGGSVAFLVAF